MCTPNWVPHPRLLRDERGGVRAALPHDRRVVGLRAALPHAVDRDWPAAREQYDVTFVGFGTFGCNEYAQSLRESGAAVRVFGDGAARVHFVGAPQNGFHESHWWKFKRGFVAIVKEYAKLAYYCVRY